MSKMTGEKTKALRKANEELTVQEEAFCQHYVVNLNKAEAFRHAFPDRAAGKGLQAVAEAASRMSSKRKIQTRIIELRESLAKKSERRFDITTDRVMQHIAAIAFSSLEDFVVIDKDGHPKLDLSKADNIHLRGLNSVKVKRSDTILKQVLDKSGLSEEDEGDDEECKNSEVEIKLPDRLAALKVLGQYTGALKQDDAPSVTINIADRLNNAIENARGRRMALAKKAG